MRTDLKDHSKMGRHFNLFLWILLLKSTKGQILFDDLDEKQQNTLNSAMYFSKNELHQSVEKMLSQKLEEMKNNLLAKVDERIENLTKNVIENFTKILENKVACDCPSIISDSDCADILNRYPSRREKDGVYNIMDVSNKTKAVYCDMTTDNGGWTVIQRRINGSVNFYLNWTEYQKGFGFADHEYWIGNDMLHRLTSLKPQELRADMERFNGEKAYAVYSNFSVGDEASKYQLQVNGYSGNAGNSLVRIHNKFSTPDQDNDEYSEHCAIIRRSGWWFHSCSPANPNGQYTDSVKIGSEYIFWYYLTNSAESLKTMQLMIRPRA